MEVCPIFGPCARPPSWQTWRDQHPAPSIAIDVVSDDRWKKDYEDNPPKYAQLGVRELLVFDPAARGDERVSLQLWRRAPDGAIERRAFGEGAVWLETAGAWALVKKSRLRFAADAEGEELYPTEAERARIAEARAEQLAARLRALGEPVD